MSTLKDKLHIIYQLQQKYPTLHVGGSIGLYLHDIELNREYHDIDLITSKWIDDFENAGKANVDGDDYGSDFTAMFEKDGIVYNVGYDSKQGYDIIWHEKKQYRVSQLHWILFYKAKYATKGVEKHRLDLEFIVQRRVQDLKDQLFEEKMGEDL